MLKPILPLLIKSILEKYPRCSLVTVKSLMQQLMMPSILLFRMVIHYMANNDVSHLNQVIISLTRSVVVGETRQAVFLLVDFPSGEKRFHGFIAPVIYVDYETGMPLHAVVIGDGLAVNFECRIFLENTVWCQRLAVVFVNPDGFWISYKALLQRNSLHLRALAGRAGLPWVPWQREPRNQCLGQSAEN
jgi:hypothetical protein